MSNSRPCEEKTMVILKYSHDTVSERTESRESRLQSIRSLVFRFLSKVWRSSSQENTPCPESPRAAEKHNNEVPFKDLARAKKEKITKIVTLQTWTRPRSLSFLTTVRVMIQLGQRRSGAQTPHQV